MKKESDEDSLTPARVVLMDVPAPAPVDGSTLTVYRRGDILPPMLACSLPDNVLSPEFLLAKDDVLFLLDAFDHERFETITIIPAGPPGSPRTPFKPQARADLDVYGTCLNRDHFRQVVLRRDHNGLYVKARLNE